MYEVKQSKVVINAFTQGGVKRQILKFFVVNVYKMTSQNPFDDLPW